MEVGLDGAPGVAAVLPAAADYRHACGHVPIHLRQVTVLPVKGVVPNLNPVTRMIVQVKYRNHVFIEITVLFSDNNVLPQVKYGKGYRPFCGLFWFLHDGACSMEYHLQDQA